MAKKKAEIITSISMSTYPVGIFRFYSVSITALDGEPDAGKEWKLLKKETGVSASDVGITYVYLLKDVIRLNRNYRIALSKETDLDNLIINKDHFLSIIKNKKGKISNSLLLHPDIFLQRLLDLVGATNLKVKMDEEDNIFDPKRMSYNPNIVKGLLSTYSIVNPLKLYSFLYGGLGYLCFQELPTISDTGKISEGKKLVIKPLVDFKRFTLDENDGVIAIKETMDYTQIPLYMTIGVGKDGSVSPTNPWTDSNYIDATLNKVRIEKINKDLVSQSAFMGSDIAVAIDVPLLDFFRNISIKYDLYSSDELSSSGSASGSSEASSSGSASASAESKKKPNPKKIYAPKDKNKEHHKLFAGERYVIAFLKHLTDIQSRMRYAPASIEVFGQVSHCHLTNVERDKDLSFPVEKLNLETMEYEYYKSLEIPPATIFANNVSITREITTEGVEYITSIQGFFLDDWDLSEGFIEKTKKEIEENMEKTKQKLLKVTKKNNQLCWTSSDGTEQCLTITDKIRNETELMCKIPKAPDITKKLLEDSLQMCLLDPPDIDDLIDKKGSSSGAASGSASGSASGGVDSIL